MSITISHDLESKVVVIRKKIRVLMCERQAIGIDMMPKRIGLGE